jgi:endonuclease/exonuclease/phosphatase (EEP) superfamily protein YafD
MLRTAVALCIVLVLVSCVSRGAPQALPDPDAVQPEYSGISDPEVCAAALDRHRELPEVPLAHDAIRLFSWNVQKNTGADLLTDMARLAKGADLILLQEATRGLLAMSRLRDRYYRAFSPGYRSSSVVSGVVTASKIPPLTQCSFENIEPWIRSPKATNVTQYSLGDRDATLLVVNLHLINFTVGVSDMEAQLNEALRVIEGHQGPVIVSGDFNTWSRSREKTVAVALARLRLTAVGFQTDLRKRVFGRALDHVYVRGIEIVDGTSHAVRSSDHNPISVLLRLQNETVAEGIDAGNSRQEFSAGLRPGSPSMRQMSQGPFVAREPARQKAHVARRISDPAGRGRAPASPGVPP